MSIILTDFDQTIAHNSIVNPATIKSMEEFQNRSNSNRIIIVTGRDMNSITKALRNNKFEPNGIVALSGAHSCISSKNNIYGSITDYLPINIEDVTELIEDISNIIDEHVLVHYYNIIDNVFTCQEIIRGNNTLNKSQWYEINKSLRVDNQHQLIKEIMNINKNRDNRIIQITIEKTISSNNDGYPFPKVIKDIINNTPDLRDNLTFDYNIRPQNINVAFITIRNSYASKDKISESIKEYYDTNDIYFLCDGPNDISVPMNTNIKTFIVSNAYDGLRKYNVTELKSSCEDNPIEELITFSEQ